MQINISDIPITLIQKKIKSIRLVVYPSREVRVSAPLRMSLSEITKFISSKINWVKEKREKFIGHNYQKKIPQKYLAGEKHYFFGEEYVLEILEEKSSSAVILKDKTIFLKIKKGSTINLRKKVIESWYRKELKKIIPKYIAEFEPKMQVRVKEFGVKKMKTRWGTCNPAAQRIWLNLELAKKPISCLEYIVVHEMVHLLEHNHSKKFFAHMDEFLPHWKQCKHTLNSGGGC